jgi:CBS domain-containing protein
MCSLDVEIPDDRARADVLAQRPHIEEAQRTQRRDLELLRRRLVPVLDEASAMHIPAHTVEALLSCMEATLAKDVDDSRELFSRLLTQESGGLRSEPRAVDVARLLRHLRASHETMLGLLEFARRTTASFTCPEGSTEVERAVYEVLAAWVGREEERLRAESDGLVARALALCPERGQGLRPVSLEVGRREILSRGGARRLLTVFCPAERRSVGLEWCRGCPLALHADQDAVRCLPDAEPRSGSDDNAPLGSDASVGEAVGRHQWSVLPEVRASEIASALKGTSASAILVVDDADRLVGVIDPCDLEFAPPDERAGVLARRSPCIEESASLAEAVECMVRAHTRYLPVLRADGRVSGVLDDLDALRWVALHR